MDNSIKDKIEDLREWVSEHAKIVMPAVLLICVLITVIVAVNANRKAAEEAESQVAEAASASQKTTQEPESVQEPETPLVALEENAYPEVNALMTNYYEALANGDIDAVASMNQYIEEMEKLKIQEMSKYIEAYPELDIYTKAGPAEGSYLVYVYSKVKFTDYDKLVPGMSAFYVCTDESGSCYINEGEEDSSVIKYIQDISLQDDAVDLNNRIAVEYNELLESDDELTAFLADLEGRIDVSVGEILEKAEAEAAAQAQAAEAETADEQTGETAEDAETQTPTVKTVRATDVVNIRSSDSETADKIGKAQIDEEFTLLEEKGNGWSKISYEGKDAFIKSEFLEVVSEQVQESVQEAQTGGNEEEQQEVQTAASDNQTSSNTSGDTVTVKESVNIRKSASESGEKLGVVYEGEKLELLMKQADGWTKVKYKGQTAYVKSEYVK